jgi:hypothetical protein
MSNVTPATASLRMELSCEGFFNIPPKQVEIEAVPETGRIYFLHKGLIVAVAHPAKENRPT